MSTELQQRVLAIWSEVLELPRAELRLDLHLLLQGGDSLHQARILSRIRHDLGVELGPDELPLYSTPRAMADLCRQRINGDSRSVTRARPGQARTADFDTRGYPATPMQQGLWYAELLSGSVPLYRSGVQLELKGTLDRPALELAIRHLHQRFPVLRSRFRIEARDRRLWADIGPVPQTVLLERDGKLRRETGGELPVETDALSGGVHPEMFEARLYRFDPRRHSLLLYSHHLCCDGWSGHVLLRELLSAYRLAVAGTLKRPPPETDTGFIRKAHAVYQSRRMDPERQHRLDWWRETLADTDDCGRWLWHKQRVAEGRNAVSPQEPGRKDFPHPVATSEFLLPAESALRVRHIVREREISPFVPMLAAFLRALRELGADRRQVIGIPLSAREAEEENSVGCFIELLPFVFSLRADEAMADLLSRLATEFRAASARLLPLPELVSMLQPCLLPDNNPWFSILFAYQNFPGADLRTEGLELELAALQPAAAQYALKFEVLPQAARWRVNVEYARALFDEQEIRTLWKLFSRALTEPEA